MERFKYIYIWKIIDGLVPDIGKKLNQNKNTLSANIQYIKTIGGKNENVRTKIRDSLPYKRV